MEIFADFFNKGLGQFHWNQAVLILIGLLLIWLAIAKKFEPLLLIPIGFGVVLGNIPVSADMALSVYDEASPFYLMYQGVKRGLFPCLVFLGIGAMTDFSPLLARPKLILLGIASPLGVLSTFLLANLFGFGPNVAASIAIIGGADGPSTIFLTTRLAETYLAPIAIAAYSYMALVPVLQPNIVRLLTSKQERRIKMSSPPPPPRHILILFPVVSFLIIGLLVPAAVPLLGMLFLGNLLKESGFTERLANTARTSLIDIVTILIGFSVGASTKAQTLLTFEALQIFALGAAGFCLTTAFGVLVAKLLNALSTDKINPIIGAAALPAVPHAARVCQRLGQEADPSNFLIMHAMAPNVAGAIGSAATAGILLAALYGG